MAPATTTTQGPVKKAAAVADLTAITGGEAPTEAEHNLIIAKVNDLLVKLRTAGIVSST